GSSGWPPDMPESIGQPLRREVAARAGGRCEYCRLPFWALLAGCEVDHVISRKHGGRDDASNLAWSCARCNRAKGTDVGSIIPETGQFSRLFNPRTDRWEDHFAPEGARLAGKSAIGRVTITLLRLNDDERVLEREWLQRLGEYP
ncbi:MAG: HNH endonuclease signature motif containing protein, partial [Opitutaceae bacterium]